MNEHFMFWVVQKDILVEEKNEMRIALFKKAWKNKLSNCVSGLLEEKNVLYLWLVSQSCKKSIYCKAQQKTSITH